MDFQQTNSSKTGDSSDQDLTHFEESLKETNEKITRNYSKLILNDGKPFSYYLKLYNKKQMFELDNSTFLTNQYKKQKKLVNKLSRSSNSVTKNSEKYKALPNAKLKTEEANDELLKDFIKFKKKLESNEENKQSPLANLTQKLVKEHKKIFSYNQYQNTNKLKHFIVDNRPKQEPLQEEDNLDIEIDIISDIKCNNNSSEQTDETPISDFEEYRPKSGSKHMNKILKNLKQRFNFKKNIIDIKLPDAIAEDESPAPLTQPNNSRLSQLSSNSSNRPRSKINIDSKKLTIHQQPFFINDKLKTPTPPEDKIESQYRLPPPQNREMLNHIYNAFSRKLKKPKQKVKQSNDLEIENLKAKLKAKNDRFETKIENRTVDFKLKRPKVNENLKIESLSSFCTNLTMLKEEPRQSYRLKANNLQLNPALNDPIKESIKNYRNRLDTINHNLNNNFVVSEFIDEIAKKNISEPEMKTEFNRQKKENKVKFTEFNSTSTKSISVIDLSDLTDQDPKKAFLNAFRPMRLNEYIKNSNNKKQSNKTLASLIIDKQSKQIAQGQVAKRATEAAANKLNQTVRTESFVKQNVTHHVNKNNLSEPALNVDHGDIFRREFSITNDSSINSSLMIVSKKRVSFHEQVLETDVISGNSTFKPIVNYKYRNC